MSTETEKREMRERALSEGLPSGEQRPLGQPVDWLLDQSVDWLVERVVHLDHSVDWLVERVVHIERKNAEWRPGVMVPESLPASFCEWVKIEDMDEDWRIRHDITTGGIVLCMREGDELVPVRDESVSFANQVKPPNRR